MNRFLIAALTSSMLACEVTAQVSGSTPPSRAQLMIGPSEFLRPPIEAKPPVYDSTIPVDVRRARFTASREWAMSHALPCRDVPLDDTTGWAPIMIGTRIGNAVLPSHFKQDTTFRSYHGGLRWTSNDVGLSIENGWWALPYDSSGVFTGCRISVRAGDYLVEGQRTKTGYAFTAVPLDPAWRPFTMISGYAQDEQRLRIVWTAFVTMVPPRCRYMTGAPVRDPAAPAC